MCLGLSLVKSKCGSSDLKTTGKTTPFLVTKMCIGFEKCGVQCWLYVLMMCALLSGFARHAVAKAVDESSCKARVNGQLIDLEPLQRVDGKPRFNIAHGAVNFTYNPCKWFNMPQDPHSGAGDQCYFVSVCKQQSSAADATLEYYTIGVQSTVKFYSGALKSLQIPAVRKVLKVFMDSDSDPNSHLYENSEYEDTGENSGKEEKRNKDEFYDTGHYGPGIEEYDSHEDIDPFRLDHGNNLLQNESDLRDESDNRYVDHDIAYDDMDESSMSSSEEAEVFYISYEGVRSMKNTKTFIYLICDPSKRLADEAAFKFINIPRSNDYHFTLHHQCFCPDGCQGTDKYESLNYGHNSSENLQSKTTAIEPKFMWLILVINGGIVVCALIIGAVFCRQGGGNGAYYNMLPALHSSRLTMPSTESLFVSRSRLHQPDFLEYTSALTKAAQPPVIDGGIIDHRDLEIGQRLGGGLFGDTYIGEFKERNVAAKRLNVGVHQNQLTDDDIEWILKEVKKLSKQHHKNLVTIMGMCCDSPQPYVILEYINGETLKEILRNQEKGMLPWNKRIKMCTQIVDAMAFLHSASQPILHRDLRCANIMVDDNERVKVCDFGFTKIMQRLRQKCTGRQGCYCRKEMSAVPSSVRWTAPEVLFSPKADESHNADILTRRCDVYSYAMVMWEIATSYDPFEDIPDEDDVIEIVKGGGRPPIDSLTDINPPYEELTKKCWSQIPENRPTFKQIAGYMKRILQTVSKTGNLGRRQHTTSTTSYMQSLLNTHLAE